MIDLVATGASLDRSGDIIVLASYSNIDFFAELGGNMFAGTPLGFGSGEGVQGAPTLALVAEVATMDSVGGAPVGEDPIEEPEGIGTVESTGPELAEILPTARAIAVTIDTQDILTAAATPIDFSGLGDPASAAGSVSTRASRIDRAELTSDAMAFLASFASWKFDAVETQDKPRSSARATEVRSYIE